MDGFFHNNALVKVIRLAVESNLLTSKYPIDFDEKLCSQCFSFRGNCRALDDSYISRE